MSQTFNSRSVLRLYRIPFISLVFHKMSFTAFAAYSRRLTTTTQHTIVDLKKEVIERWTVYCDLSTHSIALMPYYCWRVTRINFHRRKVQLIISNGWLKIMRRAWTSFCRRSISRESWTLVQSVLKWIRAIPCHWKTKKKCKTFCWIEKREFNWTQAKVARVTNDENTHLA